MAKPDSTRRTSAFLWLGFLLGIIVIFVGIRALTRTKVLVRVAPVTYGDLVSTLPTNGKVEPLHFFQAHALVPGIIQKIWVKLGQQVTPGTLLITMDDTDARARLAAAQAALAGADVGNSNITQNGSLEDRQRFAQEVASSQVEERNAAADLGTTQNLAAQGAASQGEVLRAQQRLQSAQASLTNARSHMTTRYDPLDRTEAQDRVADARASVAAAQDAIAAVDIRSPIAGTVYSIPVSPYDFAPVAEDLLDVADLQHVQVRAYFDEPEIGKLREGQAVSIRWEALPNRTWHGRVVQIPTTIVSVGTRNVGEAVIAVDDAHGDLLPSTNVTVTVTISQHTHVLTIPREALHTEGVSDFVYRIVDGHLLRTPVQVGALNLTDVEILKGLSDHDTVVRGPLDSSRELTNGLQVAPAR